jgi:hypothetical protein
VSPITAIIYYLCRLTGNHLPTVAIFYRDTSRTICQVQSSLNLIMLLATILSRQRCRTYLARSTKRPVNHLPNINTLKKKPASPSLSQLYPNPHPQPNAPSSRSPDHTFARAQPTWDETSARTTATPIRRPDHQKKFNPSHSTMNRGEERTAKRDGLAGNRTPDHSHAKGVLYH